MRDTIKLLHKIGKLKELKRTGWILRKVPNPESVADHSFRTSIMTLLLAEKCGLDCNKCVKMALIHDLAECVVGDITPHENINDEKKHKIESKAIKELFNSGDHKEIIELWEEYEDRKSLEAKFVYEIDKMEMLLQAFEYEQRFGEKNINLNEFWEYVEAKVTNTKIKEIISILKEKKKKRESDAL